MKNINKILSVVLAIILGVMPLTQCFQCFAAVAQDSNELVISDAAGLIALTENCREDTYSHNLRVTLSADIVLSDEFSPIPVFCGVFDGAGHTISGLSVASDGSYMGLFRYIKRGGEVKNLTVKGASAPNGSADYVGGIAGSSAGSIVNCVFSGAVKGSEYVGGIVGINEKGGLISGCEVFGSINGSHYTGGICGYNSGTILNAKNSSAVNTSAEEAKLTIEDIDWDSLVSFEEPSSMTDVGGVAGYSDGILQSCENSGVVGYRHIGYNIGGIVGRQSGLVNACANYGEVYGRKDVGGIAGQLEPYQSIDFDKDEIQKLLDELDVLGEKADKLISDAKGAGNEINQKAQTITWYMDSLRNSADDISARTEDIYNGWSSGINEISLRVDEALDSAAPALDDFAQGVDYLAEFGGELSEMFGQISAANEDMDAALESAKDGAELLCSAAESAGEALDDISLAADELANALGDADKTSAAVKSIISALESTNRDFKNMVSALSEISNACDKLSEWVTGKDFERLSDGLLSLGEAMGDVTRALGKMSAALKKIISSVDADGIEEALDEFSKAAAELNKAAIHAAAALKAVSGEIPDTDKAKDELSKAADNLESAGESVVKAANAISGAVDSQSLKSALAEMEKACESLTEALDDAQRAINDITEAFDRISSSDIPKDTYDEISKALEKINGAMSGISQSADEINASLETISAELDAGALKHSLESISASAAKLSEAAEEISLIEESFSSAADSLESAADTISEASESAGSAFEGFEKACEKLSSAAQKLSEAAESLGNKPAVEFPAADEAFTAAVDSFSNGFAGFTGAVSSLSAAANSQSDILLSDIEEINEELGAIKDILQEIKDKTLESSESFTTDVSEDNSASRQGSAKACANYAKVKGDLNVGGIAGSMAVDFDFDPEDDIAQNGESSFSFSYKIRDKIENCENRGEVTAKKNYCGGIVGKQDMGAVIGCTENGKAACTAGSYAGGIAGYSVGAIRRCISKASVSVQSYGGGIAGQGLIMSDNAAIFDAQDYTERAGAIAGWVDFSDENAQLSDNVFVDRGLAGIDGISYAGIAYAIGFEEYRVLAGAAAVIDVCFYVDGELCGVKEVEYAGAISAQDYPPLPEKEGCYARWEEFESDCITYPTEVNALYTPYITLIETSVKTEDGVSLVLADGLFTNEAQLNLSTQSESVFAPDGYEIRIVSLDGAESASRLRFLKPQDKGNFSVMQYINGSWQSVDYTENGSYLIVETPALNSSEGTYCVGVDSINYLPVVIICVCGAVAVTNIVLWSILLRKKHAEKKAKQSQSGSGR